MRVHLKRLIVVLTLPCFPPNAHICFRLTVNLPVICFVDECPTEVAESIMDCSDFTSASLEEVLQRSYTLLVVSISQYKSLCNTFLYIQEFAVLLRKSWTYKLPSGMCLLLWFIHYFSGKGAAGRGEGFVAATAKESGRVGRTRDAEVRRVPCRSGRGSGSLFGVSHLVIIFSMVSHVKQAFEV